MHREEKIELLHKIARTINHDDRERFVIGESDRIELIDELLKGTDYRLTEIGLCKLYSKIPISEIKEPVTVISSHIDTHWDITKPFSEVRDKKLYGTYDNSITNAAILTLMLENRIPDTVAVAFTGNEEDGMRGAEDLGEYFSREGIKPRVIVTDVTGRGYKGKNVFTIENCCNSGEWTDRVKKAMDDSGFKWKLKGNYEDDETRKYGRQGFECVSFCIPTKGEMHENSGLKTRISTYEKYIEALCLLSEQSAE